MDFTILILRETAQGFPVQTRDENTPVSDLLQTAEAYRLAALLQLHLTFSDLTISSWDMQCGFRSAATSYDNTADSITVAHDPSREVVLLALTLQLVKTLERIPAQSGSRSIHTMLYLSAAAGLRFQKRSPEITSVPTNLIPESATTQQADRFSFGTAQPEFILPLHISWDSTLIPNSALEVSRARNFVWARLSSLQRTLPNRTTDTTLRLSQAIWREYDSPQSDSSCLHWLDIMRKTSIGITSR